MRVFLAGATGAIGRALLPLLVEHGHAVTAMTRRAEAAAALRALGAEPVVCDAYDRGGLHAALERARPDAVIHQLTDLSAADTAANARLRTDGTRNLVDAAGAAGAGRIVAQSIAWAYEPGDAPAGEDVALDLGACEPRRTSMLGVAALERAVAELPAWVALRYGQLYGPGTWFAPGGARAAAAHAGTLVADADVSSFTHVTDAASAAAAALAWETGAVNVCDDEPAPGHAWVPAYCDALAAPPPPVSDAPRQPWARGADNARARALGWVPRYPSWRDGFG